MQMVSRLNFLKVANTLVLAKYILLRRTKHENYSYLFEPPEGGMEYWDDSYQSFKKRISERYAS